MARMNSNNMCECEQYRCKFRHCNRKESVIKFTNIICKSKSSPEKTGYCEKCRKKTMILVKIVKNHAHKRKNML